ncbi:MAG: 5-(carboxyamino)imidazole ribonucleotide synthase [Saprospiraceae bacterium]|nr:5-(carboxyamino)imidazole ribonucleotide synthase [Saprospiraceae bacterium]
MNLQTRLGILGGGQLGKMLALSAGNWHLPVWILDEAGDFPAASYATTFVKGDFRNYDDVYHFGQMVDVITVEIEHVNTAALVQLEKEGKIVHPSPAQLELIKDKGLQKQLYAEKGLPNASFQLFSDEKSVQEAITNSTISFPFVQKSRTAGYDGRGVAVIQSAADLPKLLPGACVIEPLVDIDKELSVIVARNENGEIQAFPVVEMDFNPDANLVEWLLCPAQIDPAIEKEADQLARRTIEAFGICGLLAVELFLTKSGELLINEVAPRPHNSGHHTIESCYTSQFEQHIRAVLNLPLGSTKMKSASVMLNLLGEPGYAGPAYYDGLEACLGMEGVNIHIYGKAQTKPYRKMGHVTVLGDTLAEALEKAQRVKERLRVLAVGG